MLETLVGQTLEGVTRWAWHQPDEPTDLGRGPVHLAFSGGGGLAVDTHTDFTLWWLEAGDCSALDRTRQYVMGDGGQWRVRDASAEAPFSVMLRTRLLAVRPLFNAVDEVDGLTLTFEAGDLTLRSGQAGEVVIAGA